MNYLNCLLIIIIIIIIFSITLKKKENFQDKDCIPKVIIATYFDKNKIPKKVYRNIKKYAPNYRYLIFDDEDIVRFLKTYYDKKILDTFYSLDKGPHRADLFRYCYLYKFGGVYLDIKTQLIDNIDKIFNKDDVQLYTVLSTFKTTIHQGIIAAKPNNDIFRILIDYIVECKKPIKIYFEFTKHFFRVIKQYYKTNRIYEGFYKDKNKRFNLYLFAEKCSRNEKNCVDGLDRYGRCCYIYDKTKKIIKTRYSDYPWK